MRRRRPTSEEIVRDVINRMFEIAGYDTCYEDSVGRKDDWYAQWTMTEEQNKEWREWGTKYLKKQKHLVKYYAERQMAMFDMKLAALMLP